MYCITSLSLSVCVCYSRLLMRKCFSERPVAQKAPHRTAPPTLSHSHPPRRVLTPPLSSPRTPPLPPMQMFLPVGLSTAATSWVSCSHTQFHSLRRGCPNITVFPTLPSFRLHSQLSYNTENVPPLKRNKEITKFAWRSHYDLILAHSILQSKMPYTLKAEREGSFTYLI